MESDSLPATLSGLSRKIEQTLRNVLSHPPCAVLCARSGGMMGYASFVLQIEKFDFVHYQIARFVTSLFDVEHFFNLVLGKEQNDFLLL